MLNTESSTYSVTYEAFKPRYRCLEDGDSHIYDLTDGTIEYFSVYDDESSPRPMDFEKFKQSIRSHIYALQNPKIRPPEPPRKTPWWRHFLA